MGWDFTIGASKQDIINDVTKDTNVNGNAVKCIAKACSGNELWTVWETPTGERELVLFLLSQHDGSWGYKDMNEIMCPYYYNVSEKLVNMVPEPTPLRPEEGGTTWRDNWRKVQNQKKAKRSLAKSLTVGAKVRLTARYGSKEFRVVSLNPLRGQDEITLQIYKLPKAGLESLA